MLQKMQLLQSQSLTATFLSVPVQSLQRPCNFSTVELIDRSRPEYLTALLAES
jgi:hypothetical protein